MSPYYTLTRDAGPHDLLVHALLYTASRNLALDLGAGALRDSRYLRSVGFSRVIAVDRNPEMAQVSLEPFDPGLQCVIVDFENYHFDEAPFDLINAQFSLPFLDPDSFADFWKKILASLSNGGIFTGRLFGINDDWSAGRGGTFHTKSEVGALLSKGKILHLEEVEKDQPLAVSRKPKHWHFYDFIIQM